MRDEFEKNILTFGSQLTYRGLSSFNTHKLRRIKPDGVIIAGMGGSGLAGILLQGRVKDLKIKIPILIWRNYGLPYHPELKNPLYIFVSFSGNTEETLSSFREALKRGPQSNIAVITTGGELLRLAQQRKLSIINFSAGTLTPRQGTGRMYYSLSKILLETNILKKPFPSYEHLKPEKLKHHGDLIAKKLKGRIITIYSDEEGKALGYIWKQKINETAKAFAFAHVIPEMNHGELTSFEKQSVPVAALFIDSLNPIPRIQKRMSLTRTIMRSCGAKVILIKHRGKDTSEKIWNSLVLADWTSYSLARLNKVDPVEIRLVSELKARMDRI